MSTIDLVFAKPVFQALGWALINFVWQGTVVAMLLAAANIFLQRRSANARYVAACIALAFMLALPIGTALFTSPKSLVTSTVVSSEPAASQYSQPAVADLRNVDRAAELPGTTVAAPIQTPSVPFIQSARERLIQFMPWFVALWSIGVMLLSLRFLGGVVVTRRLKNTQTLPVTAWLQDRVKQISAELRISKPVVILQSLLVEVPTVIGWLRPVILLPAGALAGLTPQQLESLLVHELAHIRRYDYLVNLLQTTVETLLFYHPAVWWVSQQVREEREHCCDDLAVAICGDVLIYARALAELEQIRTVSPQLAVAANGGSLLRRIQRLIGSPSRSPRRVTSWVAGLLAMVTLFALMTSAHTKVLAGITKASAKPVADSSVNQSGIRAFEQPVAKLPNVTADKTKPQSDLKEPAPLSAEASTQIAEPGEPAVAASFTAQDGKGDFIDELASAGYTGLTVNELISLKNAGVTGTFIKEMNAVAGSKLTVRELISLRNQGVSSKYIAEFRSLGYDKLTIKDLSNMSIQGVTPEYIRKLNDLGYKNLTARELISFSIHGVTPQYISEIKSLGYDHLSAEELTSMSIQGVNPSYIKKMKDIGFSGLTPRQLTSMSIQGVTPEFVQGMSDAGFKNLKPEELISMSIQGVSPAYVKKMRDIGFNNLTPRQLIQMRIQGVTPEFIQGMSDAGYKNLGPEELTSMAVQGVSPKYVKELKDMGYSNLSGRDLIRLAIHRITPTFLKKARDHGFKDLSIDQLIRLSDAGIF